MKCSFLNLFSLMAISGLIAVGSRAVAESRSDESSQRSELSWRSELLGLAPKDGIERLRHEISERFGYRTECAMHLFAEVPTWNCFVGHQQLLRAFELMGSSAANPEYLGVEKIEIGSSFKATSGRWDALKIEIPHSAQATDIKRWLTYQTQSAARVADREFTATVAGKVRETSERLGFEIQVADGLNPAEVERGLRVLSETVLKVQTTIGDSKVQSQDGEPRRAAPIFDFVVLGHKNEPLEDVNEKLRLGFDVNQSVDRAYGSLHFQYANCDGVSTSLENCEQTVRTKKVVKYRKDRVELNDIRKSLPQYDLQCGEHGNLSVEHCLRGARSFKEATDLMKAGELSTIKHVVLTHRDFSYGMASMKLAPSDPQADTLKMVYTIDPKFIAAGIYDLLAEAAQ